MEDETKAISLKDLHFLIRFTLLLGVAMGMTLGMMISSLLWW